MAPDISQWSAKDWIEKIKDAFAYAFSKWYVLLVGCLLGALIGYWPNRNLMPTYTATISFVLSTENSKGTGAGIAGLAAQLGLDAGTGGPDNVFSGDNIIELFKSKKMAMKALLATIDTNSDESLLNYIARVNYPKQTELLPFPKDPTLFNTKQRYLFHNIADSIRTSFTVFKKDKKLVFYYISATSEDEKIAFYTAKSALDQTSRFFIETKTSAAKRGLNLLRKEADSIAMVLSGSYRSTASLADRTYNINPSMMVQRSSGQFNQAKAAALGAAYTEVMRNLEVAKINLQRETPLYSIIDEPQLPLAPQKMNVLRHSIIIAIVGLLATAFLLGLIRIYATMLKPILFDGSK